MTRRTAAAITKQVPEAGSFLRYLHVSNDGLEEPPQRAALPLHHCLHLRKLQSLSGSLRTSRRIQNGDKQIRQSVSQSGVPRRVGSRGRAEGAAGPPSFPSQPRSPMSAGGAAWCCGSAEGSDSSAHARSKLYAQSRASGATRERASRAGNVRLCGPALNGGTSDDRSIFLPAIKCLVLFHPHMFFELYRHLVTCVNWISNKNNKHEQVLNKDHGEKVK